MMCRFYGNQTIFSLVLALAALVELPAAAHAAWFGLRNDTKSPLSVQTSNIINNAPGPGKFLTLYPGEVAWDSVVQQGVKHVAIHDGKKRLLYEGKIPCGNSDLFFSMQMTPAGKVILVPAMPPPRR